MVLETLAHHIHVQIERSDLEISSIAIVPICMDTLDLRC
jgi:hypothetical protein